MTWIHFDQVKLKATKRWKDADGRKRQETRTFMQTLNPFNKNIAGQVKSRAEIQDELLKERRDWLAEKEQP